MLVGSREMAVRQAAVWAVEALGVARAAWGGQEAPRVGGVCL